MADREVGAGKTYADPAAAYAAASPGDRILLYAGAYASALTIAKLVTVQKVAGQAVTWIANTPITVQAGGAGFQLLGSSKADQLDIRATGSGAAIVTMSADVTVTVRWLLATSNSGKVVALVSNSTADCIVDECQIAGSATTSSIVTASTASHLQVTGCWGTIYGWAVYLGGTSWGGQIKRNRIVGAGLLEGNVNGFDGAAGSVVANNEIRARAGSPIGNLVRAGANVKVANNTVVGGTTTNASQLGIRAGSVAGLVVRNNIVTGCWGGISTGPAFTTDHNCSFGNGAGGNWNGAAVKGAGDLELDPTFADPAAGDFRLQSGSPCRNTGVDTGETPDAAGETRPFGGAWDMGAYEVVFVAVTGATSPDVRTVAVQFSAGVAHASLNVPAAWALVCQRSGFASPVISALQHDEGASVVGLVVSGLEPAQPFRVIVPASILDTAGHAIDPAGRYADFTSARPDPVVLPPGPERRTSLRIVVAVVLNGEQLPSVDAYELLADDPLDPVTALVQAVLISVLTDATADDDDVLPDPSGDPPYRGGWCARAYLDDEPGSKLWLRARSPLTDGLVVQIRQDLERCLAWMVRDGVCDQVLVQTSRPARNQVAASVDLVAGPRRVSLRFANLWEVLRA